jgi:hypothetical protein
VSGLLASFLLIAAVLVAGAVGGGAAQLVAELRRGHDEARRTRELSLASLFAPAMAAVHEDPRVLLTWQPLAAALRARFAREFTALDTAWGGSFPFSKDALASAHARWTTEWLAWEKAHDSTYKLKALAAQQELGGAAVSEVGRATLDAIEREKLELYQRRYEEYVRVGKVLRSFIS